MSRQFAEDKNTAKQKHSKDSLQSIYNQSYQNTWSPMSSPIPDFDPMGITASVRMSSKFDEPKHTTSYKSKRRNTLPYSSSPQSSSHISSLKEVNRFYMEKIPEIVISPSPSTSNSEPDNPGPSTSKRSHKFMVTPTDATDLEKK